MEPVLIWDGAMQLGEGPIWDADSQRLWFVDIKGRVVYRYNPTDCSIEHWPSPAPVGWVIPCSQHSLVAGLKTGLSLFDPATGIFRHIAHVEPDQPDNRLNDATVGPDGVIWFGSMDDCEQSATGRVYKWDGKSVHRTSIDAVCITNGPSVSPDGSILYHVDTVGGIIHAITIDENGDVGAGRIFAQIDPKDGHPDGVTVDSVGNVWVGLWGGWRARLYSPAGEILDEVRLPAANVTKVALGGADLRTAYVTTARIGLSDEELQRQPHAGGVFSFPVKVAGQRLPAGRCPSDDFDQTSSN